MNDEIEKTEEFLRIKDNLEKIVQIVLKNKGITAEMPGYIEVYWDIKKEVLKEIYSINWKSPKDLNPDIIFN